MRAKDVEVGCTTLVRYTGCWQATRIWEPSSAERSNPSCAEVAQLAEHSPEKAGVDSSILSLGTIPRLLPLRINELSTLLILEVANKKLTPGLPRQTVPQVLLRHRAA